MNNFKGIFYKIKKEKIYFEGGAHFKYTDLVNELNKLNRIKTDSKTNLTIDVLSNSDSHRQGLVCVKHNYIKSENNNSNNKNTFFKQKQFNSNLITLNNYKDIIIKNKKAFSKDRNIIKKNSLLELFNNNLKVINNSNNKYSINSIDKYNKNNSIKFQLNNINKNTINNNNLPLIESSYFNKFQKNLKEPNKNIISQNNFNKIKPNILIKNKIYSPTRNNDYKKSIFSFKTSDIYKNPKNFETIDILSRRRNYYFGKIK